MKLVRKDNHAISIDGTLERLSGCAGVSSATRLPDGKFELVWGGGTNIYWDEQETVLTDGGERTFIDENGDSVLESEIELIEEDDK